MRSARGPERRLRRYGWRPLHREYGLDPKRRLFGGFEEVGARLGPFNATQIEIGAYNQMWTDVHLGPEQAVEAFHQAKGGLLLPVHWATFSLACHGWTEPAERLIVEGNRTGAQIAIPRPGQSIEPASPTPVERWWPDVPWQTAEEYPIVSTLSDATEWRESLQAVSHDPNPGVP